MLAHRAGRRFRSLTLPRGVPSIQRWYELPTAPLLGRLGVLAPLRPLGLWRYPRYFRTPAYLRGFPRAFMCGAGRRPAALAWARGSTGAALWAVTPPLGGGVGIYRGPMSHRQITARRGVLVSRSVDGSRTSGVGFCWGGLIGVFRAMLCLYRLVCVNVCTRTKTGFRGGLRSRSVLPPVAVFRAFGAALARARTRRPSRAGQSSQSSAGSASMRAVGQEEEQWCVIHVGVRECLQRRSVAGPWLRWAWMGRMG